MSGTGIADTGARCVVRAQGGRTSPRVRRRTGPVRQYDFCATNSRFRDLRVRFGRGEDRQAHRRRRSSSRIRVAGWRPPASADLQDVNNASCKARRSSLVRSSPSSSATRSTTVPSGKVVGSSRTRRPFSTRARRGPIGLPYLIPRCSASYWQRPRLQSYPTLETVDVWILACGNGPCDAGQTRSRAEDTQVVELASSPG